MCVCVWGGSLQERNDTWRGECLALLSLYTSLQLLFQSSLTAGLRNLKQAMEGGKAFGEGLQVEIKASPLPPPPLIQQIPVKLCIHAVWQKQD